MERTPEREAFFAEVNRDPYAAAITTLSTDAWVHGYEQALLDLEREGAISRDVRCRKTFGARREDAYAFFTDARRDAEGRMMIALSKLGPLAAKSQL